MRIVVFCFFGSGVVRIEFCLVGGGWSSGGLNE